MNEEEWTLFSRTQSEKFEKLFPDGKIGIRYDTSDLDHPERKFYPCSREIYNAWPKAFRGPSQPLIASFLSSMPNVIDLLDPIRIYCMRQIPIGSLSWIERYLQEIQRLGSLPEAEAELQWLLLKLAS